MLHHARTSPSQQAVSPAAGPGTGCPSGGPSACRAAWARAGFYPTHCSKREAGRARIITCCLHAPIVGQLARKAAGGAVGLVRVWCALLLVLDRQASVIQDDVLVLDGDHLGRTPGSAGQYKTAWRASSKRSGDTHHRVCTHMLSHEDPPAPTLVCLNTESLGPGQTSTAKWKLRWMTSTTFRW